MSTKEELARKYATRIKATQARQKNASVNESVVHSSLALEVREVLEAIDSLTFDTGERIDRKTRDELYAEIDRELGVAAGSFRMIKEGSVVSALEYERYVAALLRALEARRG